MGEVLTAEDQKWLHDQLSAIVVLSIVQNSSNPLVVGIIAAQVSSVREAVDDGNGHHVRERMLCLKAGLNIAERELT